MTTTPTSFSSVTRFTGLNSGMDIDSMVSKLMQAESIPLTKLQAQKTKNEWTQDIYRGINTSLYNFKQSMQAIRYSGNWPQPTGPADANGNATYSASDQQAIYDKISDFVSKYNDASYAIKSKLSEQPVKGYDPLTSDQKAAMSENDIALWEAQAKKGLVRDDFALSTGYNDLRDAANEVITGTSSSYNSLASIGITTGAYNPADQGSAGKLYIDSNKLKAAIAADPQGVISIFTKSGSGGSDSGVIEKMVSAVDAATAQIKTKIDISTTAYDAAGGSLGQADANLAKKIADMQATLSDKEDRYYQQFTAMDEAIGKLNSTMSWLQSTFG